MVNKLRDRLTYANVTATLALFVALGGTSYALKISGKDIRKHTLTGAHFKRNSIGGPAIKERSLAPVPRARNAARLGGQPAERFLDSCPQGFVPTAPFSDTCIELQAHPPDTYRGAAFYCSLTDNRERAGRRLPTHAELMVALASSPQIQLAEGGELTDKVYPSSTRPGALDVLYVTDEEGHAQIVPDDAAKSFRCAADPMN